MKNKLPMAQILQTLTNMFTAYLINELYVSRIEDDHFYEEFEDRKITEYMKLEVVNDDLHLSFPILFNPKNSRTKKLLKTSLHAFFEEECLPVIKLSYNWNIIKEIIKDKSLKIKFIELPDYDPFLFIKVNDIETDTKVRGILGMMFGKYGYGLIFDMQIYLAEEI